MNYTKGEWRIRKKEPWQQNDVILIESVQVNPSPDVSKRSTPIATMTRFDDEANARLIAAAPEMYEALKMLPEQIQWIPEVANAIAKAEGVE